MFLLFAGDDYYPKGGAKDLVGTFESVESSVDEHYPERYRYDGGWAHIYDSEKGEIVKSFNRGVWVEGRED
jgi:hypothetical protein